MQQAQLGSGEKAEILVWGIVSDLASVKWERIKKHLNPFVKM